MALDARLSLQALLNMGEIIRATLALDEVAITLKDGRTNLYTWSEFARWYRL
jgi:hypothetical protein